MKKSLRCLPVLFAAAILGFGVPRGASADPVSLTSGSISMPGPFRSSPIHLEGTDGVLPFSFTGSISSFSNLALHICNPCSLTATMVSLTIQSSGTDLPGMLTYGDDQYRVGGLADTSGNIFLFISGFAPLPPAPAATNELATITGSFAIERSFFQPPIIGGPFGPGNSLLGSGVATVSLFAEDPGDGVPRWSFSSAQYQFLPTPEPASFILLASGLVGIAVRRRRGR